MKSQVSSEVRPVISEGPVKAKSESDKSTKTSEVKTSQLRLVKVKSDKTRRLSK